MTTKDHILGWAFFITLMGCMYAMLIMTGCNEGSGFDWSSQPHKDIVPPPIARWTKSPSVWIDTQVYGNAPAYIAPKVPGAVAPIHAELRDYSAARNHVFTAASSAAADVVIRFYCGKYVENPTRTVSSADGALDWLLSHRVPVVVIDDSDKAVSAGVVPPPREANWNGVVYMRSSSRKIKSAECWINVYAYQYFTELAAARPDLKLDPDAMFRSYLNTVYFHEGAHWCWGLADDVDGCLGPDGKQIGGLMNYKLMISRPNKYEEAVLEWLY